MLSLISLLVFAVSLTNTQSNEFTCVKDVNVNTTLQQSALIASFDSHNSKVLCVGACNRNPECLSCSFNEVATIHDCFLYNRVFTSNDYSYASNVNWHTKKVSLMRYFQNAFLQSNISNYNGIPFAKLMSTEIALIDNVAYYFMAEWSNNLLIKMSSTLQLIANVTLEKPRVIKWANDHLYITSKNGFFKMDYNFNTIKAVNENNSWHSGIYHNTSDGTVAVAASTRKLVEIYDANLTLLANITLSPYKSPLGISGYGSLLYVSALYINTPNNQTVILVIRNKGIIDTISISTSIIIYINSIYIDEYGYMALSFQNQKAIMLYHTNGTNTGLSLTLYGEAYHINFDINRRMMISNQYALRFIKLN